MIRLATVALVAFAAPAMAQTAASNVRTPFAERFAGSVSALPKSTVPVLRPTATVTGAIVRIGDLVENAGEAAQVAIFRAPDLGQTGAVPAGRVLEAVRPHLSENLETRGVTEVVVTRASTAIAAGDIEARLVHALAERLRSTDAGNLTLTFDGEVRTIDVEPGTDLRIARLGFDPRSGRFDVLFERSGARNFIRFTGSYAETFEAAAVAHPLAAGTIVKDSDIRLVRRPKAEFGANVITSPTQAVGLATKRAMRPGEVIRQTDLTKPEVVARNDNVTITYEVPGIMLTIRGKATEAGARGDVINVLNVQSNRTIQATVAGPGHVIVTAPMRVNVTATTTTTRLAADATGRPNPRANPE